MKRRYFSNPMVDEPLDSYKNVWRAYSEWPIKWWREVVQNGVDAGADEIRLAGMEQPDGTWVFSCEDDGSGMDKETLVQGFFTIGGTRKPVGYGEGEPIGGFGEAKKLIAFAWPEWTIHTRDVLARGTYRYYDLESAPYRHGTKVTVKMPSDRHTTIPSAMELLQRSSTRGVRFFVNDERFGGRLLGGKDTESRVDLGGGHVAIVYHNKSSVYNSVFVRAGGLYMFTYARVYREGFGSMLVEIPGPASKEALQDNRDGLRSDLVSEQISKIYSKIVSEGERAFKTKSFTKTWMGEGYIGTAVGESDVINAMVRKPPPAPGKALEVSKANARDIEDVLRRVVPATQHDMGQVTLSAATPDVFRAIIEGGIKAGRPNQEALASQLVWSPAFMIKNEIEDYTVPRKFYPEEMSPKAEALLKIWAEACRLAFILLGSSARYGVGFVFSREVGAMYAQEEGGEWLLINPLSGGTDSEKLWNKSSREDLHWLYSAAVHEVTHMADGCHEHLDAFAYALTRNFALTADGFKIMMRVAREVKVRKEDRAREARTAAGLVEVYVQGDKFDINGTPMKLYVREASGSQVLMQSRYAVEALVSTLSEQDVDLVQRGVTASVVVPLSFLSDLMALEERATRGLVDVLTSIPIYLAGVEGGRWTGLIYPEEPNEFWGSLIGLEVTDAAYRDERGSSYSNAYEDGAPFIVAEGTALHAVLDGELGEMPGEGEEMTAMITASTLYYTQVTTAGRG